MRKAELFMVDDSTPVYLQKVETILEEEKQRVLSYMNRESDVKVQHVVETKMLAKKKTELLEKEGSGCKVLLLNDMNEDLSRWYRLFSRIPDGLIPVSEIFKSHLNDLGNEKIEQRLSRAEKAGEVKSMDKSATPRTIRLFPIQFIVLEKSLIVDCLRLVGNLIEDDGTAAPPAGGENILFKVLSDSEFALSTLLRLPRGV